MVFAVLGGFLLSTSFAPLSIWWVGPLAIALLLKSLDGATPARRVMSLYLFGLSFLGPLLHWTSIYVGAVPWIILTVLESIFFLPLAFISRIRSWSIFLFPSIWVALEGLRSRFPFGGFGWGRLAFGQADAPYASLAAVGGAPLLSFFVALLAIFIYLLVTLEIRKATAGALIAAVIFSSIFVVGQPHQVPTFSVAAVQGGVPQLGLDFNARATAVFHNHLRVTDEYLRTTAVKPDLIIWPENSVDVDPFRDQSIGNELQGEVNKYQTPILIGAVLDKDTYFQNASILWMPKIGATTQYIKRHLTPFGEYIPLRTLAEFISPYAKTVIGFRPGTANIIHRVGPARIGPVICYELLDDQLGRQVAKESNFLVVQTNSATFGLSAESAQQLAITRIRAIEHQREIVSVATSGISAIINAQGRVLRQTQQNQSAVITQKISLNPYASLADRLGAFVEFSIILLPFLLWILGLAMKRRRKI